MPRPSKSLKTILDQSKFVWIWVKKLNSVLKRHFWICWNRFGRILKEFRPVKNLFGLVEGQGINHFRNLFSWILKSRREKKSFFVKKKRLHSKHWKDYLFILFLFAKKTLRMMVDAQCKIPLESFFSLSFLFKTR